MPLRAETLADAINLAYRTNPTLGASRYELRAADEELVQAKSELRPTADVQGTAGYDYTIEGRAARRANPLLPTSATRDTAQAALTITQPLYTGGRAAADRRTAEAGIRAGREALRIAEGDLLLGVVTAYLDVRRYDAAREVWRTSISELEALTKEIEARREAGELTLTDVAQARRQVALAREQYVLTEQAFEAARTDYAALVGHDPDLLDPEPLLPQLPRDADSAYVLAERESPELARALFTELQSRNGVDVARSQGMPTVSLRGSGSISGGADPYRYTSQDKSVSGSLVVTVPITAGGRVAAQIRQAEDRNGVDRFRVEATRREMVRAVALAWNEMVTAERAALLLDEQRREAITQLDGTINEYRAGLRSTFDVLYAQQTLRDAEVSLLGSRRDRYLSEATLLRRTGLLESRAIMIGVELHDPSAHLRAVENDNVLPWDGLVAALDRAGTPHRSQKPVMRPASLPEHARIAAAAPSPGANAELTRKRPVTPLPGTAGRSGMLPSEIR